MRTREQLWIFVAALSLLLLQQATGAGLTEIFVDGVPGYGTAPGVTVTSRVRPETDPPPTRVDGFLIRPQIAESLGYDDNVLSGQNRRGSWLSSTNASVLAASGWSRNALGVFLSAGDTRYWSQAAQDRTDGTASVGGSLDIGRDRLTIGLAHLSLHEDRSALNALASDRPVAYRIDDVRVSYTTAFDRLTVIPEAELSAWHYGDTTVLGQFARQAYRDRSVLRGGTTFRYEFAPLRSAVLVTRALTQHYLDPLPGQPSLNSTGYQALMGLDYDGDSVWRARVLMGGESRQFAAARYRAHTAMIAEGDLTWNPTGMTTVHATLTRSIEDAAQEGVSGFTFTEAKLCIDHELRRDVLLNASAGLRGASYLQGGQQSGFSAGAGVTWMFSRYGRVSATYDLNTAHGSGPLTAATTGFSRDVALMTVRLGL
jgi:hypothetical protein